MVLSKFYTFNPVPGMISTAELSPVLADYSLGRHIGKGAFGVVVEGVRRSDSRPVAIKIVPMERVTTWVHHCGEQVPQEVKTLRVLQEVDGVVDLLSFHKSENYVFLVLGRPELYMDLYRFMEFMGSVPEDLARRFFRRIVRVVTECWARHQLLHNDLKEENLVVDLNTMTVTVIDWGQACEARDYPANRLLGTRGYVPPEFFRPDTRDPLQGLVWSLGVTLFSLTHWGPPFRGERGLQIRDDLSEEGASFIRGCLDSDPSTRLTFTQLIGHPWICHTDPAPLNQAPTHSTSSSSWLPSRLTRRRRRGRNNVPPTTGDILEAVYHLQELEKEDTN